MRTVTNFTTAIYFLLFYLKGRREEEMKRQLFPIHWFTSQMSAMAGLKPGVWGSIWWISHKGNNLHP